MACDARSFFSAELLISDPLLRNRRCHSHTDRGQVSRPRRLTQILDPNISPDRGLKRKRSVTAPWRSYSQFVHGGAMEDLVDLSTVELQTLLDSLASCGKSKDIVKARQMHSLVVKNKLFPRNPCLHNAILCMYTRCGKMGEAREAFDGLPMRNVVTWNTLISGYIRQGQNREALDCYERMIMIARDEGGIFPNAITHLCALKACASLRLLEAGKEIHRAVNAQRGLLRRSVNLGNALVDMYAKCGEIHTARQVFDELFSRDVVSWNVLISGYSDHGLHDEALDCLMHMQHEGTPPNATTLVCLLKACHGPQSLIMGEKIHSEALRLGLLGKNIILGNAIMDMYVKCGMLEKGREVFEHELMEKDTASWNTMINGYSQHGLDCEALGLFLRMQEESPSLPPNAVTFVSVLKACGSSGALEMGEGIHAEVRKKGRVLETNAILGNAIVDMYAKCGMLGDAWRVFDKLPIRNVASWNALITGYAQHGYPKMAFHLFAEMNAHNVDPDLITFLILLNVCSHSGLVDEGRVVLDAMHHIYRLPPTLEHYACMVDLFSRSGCFEKALLETEKVLDFERLPLWWSLLGASSKWLNVEVGRWAFERSLEVDRKCADTYICMRNIYAAAGMLEEAQKIEAQRVRNEADQLQECLS